MLIMIYLAGVEQIICVSYVNVWICQKSVKATQCLHLSPVMAAPTPGHVESLFQKPKHNHKPVGFFKQRPDKMLLCSW